MKLPSISRNVPAAIVFTAAITLGSFGGSARAQSESGGLLLTPAEMIMESEIAEDETLLLSTAKAVVKKKESAAVGQSGVGKSAAANIKSAGVNIKSAAANIKSAGAKRSAAPARVDFAGLADYYHHSLYGRKTSSGRVLHPHLMTAAHRTLPFGTKVRVTSKVTGRSCIVEINDRGPFTKSKVIDLSHAAAKHLGMLQAGTCQVACTVLPDGAAELEE